MNLPLVIKGLVSFIPGVYNLFSKHKTGGTDSADYCYEVWLKHLTLMWENGLQRIPDTVAELGPGDSIGIGLAALLSGVDKYYALDVVKYVNNERNLFIFDELVKLFKKRAGRPKKGWPDYDGYLDSSFFPSHILTEQVLDSALRQERIESIRNMLLTNVSGNKMTIKYVAPWNDLHVVERESVDVILSHSVLEHVVDLEKTCEAFSLWLKPDGLMSHQIDLSSHGLSKKWNGHWTYSQLMWKIIVGKKYNMINRQPCSKYIALLEKNRFKIRCLLKRNRSDGIKRRQLSSRWRDLSEDDFTCSGMFVQARKVTDVNPAKRRL